MEKDKIPINEDKRPWGLRLECENVKGGHIWEDFFGESIAGDSRHKWQYCKNCGLVRIRKL